jgi:peptidoglycan L-alanyl-D-glutamate endopeptidase CwlK
VTNTEYRILFAQKLAQFILQALSGGIRLMPYWIERSAAEQFQLYQQGRTAPGRIVTNCDGRKKISRHQRWRAADLVIVGDDGKLIWDASARYELLGRMWKDLGGKWGGDFALRDYGHFEL